MSLWGLFITLGSIGVILSLGAAVMRPRDRAVALPDGDVGGQRVALTGNEETVVELQARVDALETEVDDLHRAIAALREETEYLQHRIEGDSHGPHAGEFS